MLGGTESGPEYFSSDYATARSRFRRAADAAGARRVMLVLPERHCPAGGDLSIDIAVLGAPLGSARRVLLHCSGLHGVEGFAGSAIQLAALADPPCPPRDGAVVFVHIINPWGMAWLRRCNENNVDLNRNFLPPGELYRGSPPVYAAVDSWLNPPTPPGFDFFWLKVAVMLIRYGFHPMKQTIAGGQYDYPHGLFFGGHELQLSARMHRDWIKANLSAAERVVTVDVHTGLGRFAEDVMLVDLAEGHPVVEQMLAAFGPRVRCLAPTSPAARNGVAYVIRGGHHEGVAHAVAPAESWFVTQEFGTRIPIAMLAALREENRLHHWGTGDGSSSHGRPGGESVPLDHPAKRVLLESFVPVSPTWRAAVVRQGRDRLRQAAQLAFGP